MTTKQLTDIFYKGTYEFDLCTLEKYMLTHTFFTPTSDYNTKHIEENALEPTPTQEPVLTLTPEPVAMPVAMPVLTHVPTPEPKKHPIKTRFRSYLKDSLFWCMYVHSHGYTAFETHKAIGTNMLNLMMNEKRTMSEYFNKDDNRTALKNTNHKITNIKTNEIKCDLMTKPMLSSIEALIPCCVYWKCPIYVDLGNKTFLHFVPNTYVSDDDATGHADPNAVLLYICEGRFEMMMDAEKKAQHIQEMCQTFYKIPHYEKPLLSIGSYKTDEIQYLYDMIMSENDIVCSKMKKQDMYAAVIQKCAQGIVMKTMY